MGREGPGGGWGAQRAHDLDKGLRGAPRELLGEVGQFFPGDPSFFLRDLSYAQSPLGTGHAVPPAFALLKGPLLFELAVTLPLGLGATFPYGEGTLGPGMQSSRVGGQL